MKPGTVTLEGFINEIEKQTDYLVVFSNQEINPKEEINLTSRSNTVSNYLNDIFKGTNVHYVFDKNYIILTKNSLENTLLQGITITGVVADENGEPLPGVNVIMKGTLIGQITDVNGKYSITVAGTDATLIFSFVGYVTQEITIGNQHTINITLAEETHEIEEVVVVGYGAMKKKDLTGSVQRINASQYQAQSNTNLGFMLNGTVAGFSTNHPVTSGGVGSMEVRGPTSLKASNEPLIVIDGVIFQGTLNDLNHINPSDIESIDILKDASSAAIFGARSASGVMIITTKRGTEGKPTINFSAKLGVVGLTKHMRPFGPDTYLQAKGDFRKRRNPSAPSNYYTNPYELPSDISIDQWLQYDPVSTGDPTKTWLNRINLSPAEQNNYLNGTITDWYDKLVVNGLRQDYNISLYGGTPNIHYYWSNGYTHNQGYRLGDEYKVFRSRLNLDAKVTNFLKVGFSSQYAGEDRSAVDISMDQILAMSPFTTPTDENGDYMMYPNDDTIMSNPYLYYLYRDKFNKTQSLLATMTADLMLPFGFSFQFVFSNRLVWAKDYYFDPVNTPNGLTNGGYGSRINSSVYDYSIDNILKWNKVFADIHKFDVTLLMNVEKYQSWKDTQTNSKFSPSGALTYHALQGGINPNLVDDDQYSTGNALMARLNYSLKNRYLLTLSYRRDGYSAFGLNNPYANFSSAAVGWNIAEEDFFNKEICNYLKLRASWGTNGNRGIGRYDAMARLATTKYFYGENISIGVYTNTMANDDLKWERTSAFNFGLDFGVFRNRINGSIDFYDMTTKDLLLDRSLPVIIGYSKVTSNMGELKNKGFELTLNSININSEKLTWNSTLVFSFNRNKIKHLYGDLIDVKDADGNVIGQKEADDITNSWFIGQSIDRIWDYEVLGVYQSEDVAEAKKYGKEPGDIILKDVNGDGKLLPNDDKVFQGYTKPRYKIGLRNDFRFFKDFEASFFIRADIGAYAANNLYKNSAGGGQFERINSYDLPYWTPENPNNKWARLASNFSSPGFNIYDNCTFVRLQEISLSYHLPKNMIKKAGINDLSFFINAHNLITVTGWSFWDPESKSSPMPKFLTFGLNLTL